jgi:protein-S-isoprenylcysteine O-methyltransferase Ste14
MGNRNGAVAERRITRWGVGPKIGVPAAAYTFAAWAATAAWPGVFLLPAFPVFVEILGAVLIVAGLTVWIMGAIAVMRAYNRDELVTTGIFALVRHPVYAGWISLALPGLALVTRSWPMFLTPFLAYAIFRRFIPKEDEYLKERFGQPFVNYRRRVNEVIPIPRFWDRG